MGALADDLSALKEKAAAGDAEAQLQLGLKYANGEGIPEAEAAKWFQKAAKQGNAKAQLNLGMRYTNGQGVSKDSVY